MSSIENVDKTKTDRLNHLGCHGKQSKSQKYDSAFCIANPTEHINILNKLTYHWLTPIFVKGYKHPLDASDIYQIPSSLDSARACDELTQFWNEELELQKQNPQYKANLARAIRRYIFRELMPAGIMKFISDLATVSSPLLLRQLITYVAVSNIKNLAGEEIPPLSLGIAFVLGIFALAVVNLIFFNYFWQISMVCGLKVRTALSSMVYQKSLRLSTAARQDFSSGKVMTVVSTDTARIEQFIIFAHIIWTAPIQILVLTGLMYYSIGYAAIVGVALLIVLTPLQGVLFKQLAQIRKVIAPLTDKRVKMITEIISGIRVIKFFTWETPFLKKIEEIRKLEIQQVFKKGILGAITNSIIFGIPVISASLAFIIYGLTQVLNPADIFPTLTWFGQLRFPLMFLPQVLVGLADAKVAIVRITELLLAQEIETVPEHTTNTEHAVQIINGEFQWETLPPVIEEAVKGTKKIEPVTEDLEEKPKTPSSLTNINISIPKGSLVAIVGPVGSGKSSLLNAMLGEMKKLKGRIVFDGDIGYAAQNAWIQNASVEKNITFGLEHDQEKYADTIRVCQLEKDLLQFPDGDQTEIGEKGINVSGGQKQRINLARCVYRGSDIVLLDDPLSAVDAHVGKALFETCISTALADKTRILVTHQLHFLPQVDYIILMEKGSICEQGTYQTLINSGGAFSKLMESYGAVEEDEDEMPETGVIDGTQSYGKQSLSLDRINLMLEKGHLKNAKELMSTEERSTGSVSAGVWSAYMNSSGGYSVVVLMLSILVFLNLTKIGTDYWLIVWTNNQLNLTTGTYIGIYWAWGVSQAIFLACFGILFAYTSTAAAIKLHHNAAKRIVQAPTSFFDTTPQGRIINRFSKDQDGIDSTIADSMRMFFNTAGVAIATFALIIYATPFFLVALVPLMGVYWFVQKVYRATSRELKRIDSISRSPLYAHFGETLTGLSTIRAYNVQDRFIKICNQHFNSTNSPFFVLITAQRWLGVRLEVIGSLLVFFAGMFAILSRATISPSIIGLSLSYALQVTGVLNWCVRQFAEVEIAMNAVERVHHYGKFIEVEPPAIVDDKRPPGDWPSKGTIVFKNVEMRYGPTSPLILKKISFSVNDKEKIGIVGRTGSGKSSIMNALMRMVEIDSGGEIIVDNIDITKIGTHDVRSKLAIIPQDPVLFSGTYRSNLDPFSEHTDSELWDSLERSGLKASVVESEGGLDFAIQEGGDNLSVGQRQLLCLSRAMLKKPKILIMDEATANVDYHSDSIIQKSIRQDFLDSTVLTIAHRLNTIIDYDRVVVLDHGEILEFDTPKALLQNSDGVFSLMIAETGKGNSELLKSLAKG